MKKGTLNSYTTGFLLSILLTIIAYFFVYRHVDSGHYVFAHETLTVVLIGLALIQFYVQAVFFLHLGSGKGARWNLISFLFMIGVVSAVVLGSLWIMANLDYHHGSNMTPQEKEKYIIEDENPQDYPASNQEESHHSH